MRPEVRTGRSAAVPAVRADVPGSSRSGWSGAPGWRWRTPKPSPVRRPPCRCRTGGGYATHPRTHGSPCWISRQNRPRSHWCCPARARGSASPRTSSHCSRPATGSRCGSPSTCGPTRMSSSMPTSSSTRSGPDRCRATASGRRSTPRIRPLDRRRQEPVSRWWGAGADRGDTDRLEAFSDGVLAIAVTLLILDVRVDVGSCRCSPCWSASRSR